MAAEIYQKKELLGLMSTGANKRELTTPRRPNCADHGSILSLRRL